MDFERYERGYLLPDGCKDLIDLIRLRGGKHFFETVVIPPKPPVPKESVFGQPAIVPPSGTQISIPSGLSVRDLAALIGKKPFVIIGDLMQFGIFANMYQLLDFETAARVLAKYGYVAKRGSLPEL